MKRGVAAGQRQGSQLSTHAAALAPMPPGRDLCAARCCLKKVLLNLRVVVHLLEEQAVLACLGKTQMRGVHSLASSPRL